MKNPTINDIIQAIESAEIAYANEGIIANYVYDRKTNTLSVELPLEIDVNVNVKVFCT